MIPNSWIIHVWETTFQRKDLCIPYFEIFPDVVDGILMQ